MHVLHRNRRRDRPAVQLALRIQAFIGPPPCLPVAALADITLCVLYTCDFLGTRTVAPAKAPSAALTPGSRSREPIAPTGTIRVRKVLAKRPFLEPRITRIELNTAPNELRCPALKPARSVAPACVLRPGGVSPRVFAELGRRVTKRAPDHLAHPATGAQMCTMGVEQARRMGALRGVRPGLAPRRPRPPAGHPWPAAAHRLR